MKINWWTVLQGLVAAGALAVCGWVGTQGKRVYAEHKVSYAHSEQAQAEKQIARQQVILDQIAGDVAVIKKQTMTVVGNAKIIAGDESYMLINTTGKAAQYAEQKKARVTNIGHADALSVLIQITGTLRNENENNIAVLSKKAAMLLGEPAAAFMRVRIEPEGK